MKKINLNKMIKEEIINVLNEDGNSNKNDILEKYKNLPLKFSGYYKYSFSFKGNAPGGIEVYASVMPMIFIN